MDVIIITSHIQEAYALTKSLISAPMGTTGSSSAREVEAAGDFDIKTASEASRGTRRQISRGESRGEGAESRDQGSDPGPPTPTAEVRSESTQQLTGIEYLTMGNRNVGTWELTAQLALTLAKTSTGTLNVSSKTTE